MERVYCWSCRRYRSVSRFNLAAYEDTPHQFCQECEEAIMTAAQERQILQGESAIVTLLQQREGGEREVMLPIGRIDLLTDEYVIEVKHIRDWLNATKVLAYQTYYPDKKARIHIYGGYNVATRELVTSTLEKLGITVTWETEAF